MRRWRRRMLGLLLAAGILGGLYAARGSILPLFAWWLDVGEIPRRADYVMLLSSDDNTRPFVAAAVAKALGARKVLFADARADGDTQEGITPPWQETIRRVLVCRGVSPGDIVALGQGADTTFDEATCLAGFLDSAGDARVVVVTSNYHTRRARWVIRQVLGARAGQISMLSAPADGFDAARWWESDKGFITVLAEYLKLGYYQVRYGFLGYWMGAVGVLVVLGLSSIWWWRRRRGCVLGRNGTP